MEYDLPENFEDFEDFEDEDEFEDSDWFDSDVFVEPEVDDEEANRERRENP